MSGPSMHNYSPKTIASSGVSRAGDVLKRNRATLIGLCAIIVWGLMFGFVRRTSVAYGEFLGPALIYSLAAVIAFVGYRPSPWRELPRRYLLISGGIFVVYESVLAASIGLAASSEQTLEISLVNYLWPSMLVLMGAFASKYGWLDDHRDPARYPRHGVIRRVVPGVLVSTFGVLLAVGGNNGLDPAVMAQDIASNPVPFALSLLGALLWSTYSTFTGKLACGKDATAYFLAGVAVVMWAIFFANGAQAPQTAYAPESLFWLFGAGASIGVGYIFWGYGLQHGDIKKMGIGSYAAPLISVIFSVAILGVAIAPIFWVGTVCVVAGSLIDWRLRR